MSPQFNLSIDDELHGKILEFSKSRGSTVQEVIRTAVRSHFPNKETVEVVKEVTLELNAFINEVHLKNSSHWFGIIEMTNPEMDELKIHLGSEIKIKMGNGRQGNACVISLSFGNESVLVGFSGMTTLS